MNETNPNQKTVGERQAGGLGHTPGGAESPLAGALPRAPRTTTGSLPLALRLPAKKIRGDY